MRGKAFKVHFAYEKPVVSAAHLFGRTPFSFSGIYTFANIIVKIEVLFDRYFYFGNFHFE